MSAVLKKNDEIAVYNEFRAQLAELEKHNKSMVFDYEDPKGNKEARSHVYKLRQTKAAVEKARKAEKQDALDYGRRVDSEAREIADELQSMIDVHEAPLKEIEQREKDRIAKLEAELDALENIGPYALESWDTMTVDDLKACLADTESAPITDERWAEYIAGAARAKDKSVGLIREAIAKREKSDAEQAELERLRKEAAEREQKERDERIAREAAERAQQEADRKARAEREAAEKAAQEAQDKAKREAAELTRRAEQAEREKVEAEERGRIAAENAAKREREAQAERERKEKEEAERREANRKHREKVQGEAIAALVDGGVDEKSAAEAVRLISIQAVPHVRIAY